MSTALRITLWIVTLWLFLSFACVLGLIVGYLTPRPVRREDHERIASDFGAWEREWIEWRDNRPRSDAERQGEG